MSDFNYPTMWLKAMENHPLHANKQTKENGMQQTTIEQMEQTVEQLLAKAEELKQQIEKVKKEDDVWPKYGDEYWFAISDGSVTFIDWSDCESDQYRKLFGNVHRTKEEAENYVQKRLVQVELENLAKKAWKEHTEQPLWESVHQCKWFIYYNHDFEDFFVNEDSVRQSIGQVYFPTAEAAKAAINTIGEERLKKLFM